MAGPWLDRLHARRDSAVFLRDEKICLYRQAGMPLRRIGEKFDLSPERVRAIVYQRERWAQWHAKAQQRLLLEDGERSRAMARKLLAHLA